MAFIPIAMNADPILINGIYYNINTSARTAEVTSGNNSYTGNVTIPQTFSYGGSLYTVKSIGNYAFYQCSNLKSVSIPYYGVTSIGDYAFARCSSLTSVSIPSGVTSIGQSAFEGCSSLTSITIPNGVTSIEGLAFLDCSSLTSITIPNSVTSIGQSAFEGCSGLTSITIPNSVTSIGGAAFSDCSGLTSITVASGNTVYDSRNNCNAIIEKSSNKLIAGCKNTTIPNSVKSIGNFAFDGCSGLTSIAIPYSVTSIGQSAFGFCSGLTSITIPYSVTSIGGYAFISCTGLTSITIPYSVTSIGEYAFQLCSGLTSVFVEWDSPLSVPTNLFEYVSLSKVTLYVPAGTKAAYQTASVWNSFGNIVENTNINFADANVKSLCVANWDTNHDGELSIAEAAAVTSISNVFSGKTNIRSFNELQYFTGLTGISLRTFYGCSGLTSITIPNSVTSIGGGFRRLLRPDLHHHPQQRDVHS